MIRLLFVLAGLLAAVPALAASDPSDVLGIAYVQKPGAPLPADAILSDETGQPVRLGELAHGVPTLLALVYYRCPNLCGVVLGDLLSGLQGASLVAGRDYRLVAISIDPAEGPDVAAQAKAQHLAEFPAAGATPDWHFLTGNAAPVERAVGYQAKYDAALKQFIHPAGIVVATPDGHVSRYLLGVGYAPGDLKLAVTEASDGTIAALARPILLTCWHYDPARGRYSLALWNLVRIAGALTVLTIGVTLFLAFRRDRRAP